MISRREHLGRQRWFVRTDGEILDVEPLAWSRDPAEDGFGVRVELVRVATAAGGTRTYQVPASYRREPFPGLEGALMAIEDGMHVYDAMLDAHARTALLAGFGGRPPTGLDFQSDADLGIGPRTPTVPLVAEQSNTSIIVGDDLLWKLFRIVEDGPNPDVEVGRALTATGTSDVAPVRGWIRAGDVDLGMLYDYYPTASDGWRAARASVRDLLVDPDLGPEQDAARDDAQDPARAGGDFAAEAHRLGATVAAVHRLMADLGSSVLDPPDVAARLRRRFDATSAATHWGEAAHRAFEELAELSEPVVVQRVHGDLHLGQTLRTVDGWRVFDFEGEPAAPLTERRRPDSPLRDVAGMLRSFDYAPWSVAMQLGIDDPAWARRAAQWSERNGGAFLAGYGVSPGTSAFVLLRCYQIDKAAYELDYERDHRPGWSSIPRDALHRLLD